MDDASETARRAAVAAGVEIRATVDLAEAGEVVRLQRETWGDTQLVPKEMIRALQAAGVPPLAAFAGDRMVGFALGFGGAGEDGPHLHSHMLAVEPEFRSAGVGRALKLAQRAWALDRGIGSIRWTFDPLIARNDYFNLHLLGGVADRFHRHHYGDMADRINAGERTDRLELRWDLARTPGPRAADPGALRIEVPPDHETLRRTEPATAARLRDEVSEALERHLAEGLVAIGFDRSGSALLLARDPGAGSPG